MTIYRKKKSSYDHLSVSLFVESLNLEVEDWLQGTGPVETRTGRSGQPTAIGGLLGVVKPSPSVSAGPCGSSKGSPGGKPSRRLSKLPSKEGSKPISKELSPSKPTSTFPNVVSIGTPLPIGNVVSGKPVFPRSIPRSSPVALEIAAFTRFSPTVIVMVMMNFENFLKNNSF